ncbi:unnamed protein product [Candida verbasci]|uniref:DH domain-containing protein n=1 Tax=Candida verbasci TaxID=1227364 RepID=A0A9W4TT39_9ASCO|nr:unnamed protein product [Candida verbasci]
MDKTSTCTSLTLSEQNHALVREALTLTTVIEDSPLQRSPSPKISHKTPFKKETIINEQHPKFQTISWPIIQTSSYSDLMISPKPNNSYSPIHSQQLNIQKNLYCILNEIELSESSYFNQLKSLQANYYQELINNSSRKIEIPIPIINTNIILISLCQIHENLHRLIREVFNNQSDLFIKGNKIIDLINHYGICVYWYRWYCSLHELMSSLITNISIRNGNSDNTNWFKGWQNFMEGAQPILKCKDLSFISLSHKPIDRIVKYRLFIENIRKDYVKLKHGFTFDQDQEYWNTSRKLKIINEESRELYDRNAYLQSELKKLIWIDLKYETYPNFYDFNFFGHPMFIGLVNIIYMKSLVPVIENCPVLLFKSHLIICQYEKHHHHYFPFRKYSIKFIIPLMKCKIMNNDTTGLFINYTYSFKIIFKLNLTTYELIFCFLNELDCDNWYDGINTLINFVNDNNFDEEYDEINYFQQIPNYISPKGINLHHSDFQKLRKNCYFDDLKIVQIKFDPLLNVILPPDIFENKIFENLRNEGNLQLILKKQDLMINERWFNEIIDPRLIIYTNYEDSKRYKLMKSLSTKKK